MSGKRNQRVLVNAVQTRKQQKEQEEVKAAEQQAWENEQPCPIPLDESVGKDVITEEECEMRSEGRVVNELNRNEDEFEVLCNLGGVKSLGEGGSIVEEYKRLMKQDESMKEWKKLAEKKKKGLRWVEGVLQKQFEDDFQGIKELLVIPKGMRARLVRLAHDHCGHIGTERVTWALRQNFTRPGMHKQIKAHCQQCDTCQKARRGKERKIPMGEMPLLTKPFENVAVDLVGPLPRTRDRYKYILTYICLSSRYPDARPLKTVMASEVVEALLDIFCHHGIPNTVLSNQGTQFMSSMMRATCKQLGVKQKRTTPYHPQSNGCVERLHGSLLPMLRKKHKKG